MVGRDGMGMDEFLGSVCECAQFRVQRALPCDPVRSISLAATFPLFSPSVFFLFGDQFGKFLLS